MAISERRRLQNAKAQAAYRERKRLRGLVQEPTYVALESRPGMRILQRAFDIDPYLRFDPSLACLRDPRTGRVHSPLDVLAKKD